MITDPKFFKKENNEKADEFKKFLPVNVNTSFRTLAPAIATAEQNWVRKIVGEPLFDRMAKYYAERTDTASDNLNDHLVELFQMAVVRLAYWDSFDQLAVTMADNGIRDTNGENRAYRYQADALRNSLFRQGYAYINSIAGFCTKHIKDYPEFKESHYYSVRSSSLIRDMDSFEMVSSIGRDFCVFVRLRDFIEEAETMELPFRIGQSLCDQLHGDQIPEPLTRILPSIRGFLVHWSLAEAIPSLNVAHTPQGLMVVSEESRQGGSVQNAPTPEQVDALVHRHREMAARHIGKAVSFMKAHPSDYPGIEEIGTDSAHESDAAPFDNNGHKTFLV